VCQSAGVEGGSGSSSSNSEAPSNSSSVRDTQHAKWGHLLRLPQYSPQWAAAAAVFSTKWHDIDWQSLSQWQSTSSNH
jgi:hypothetical protein